MPRILVRITVALYVPGGYEKTKDVYIPLNNKPLSKRCCVCILKELVKTEQKCYKCEHVKET